MLENKNLTTRQEQIVNYLWEGLNTKEIADKLKLAEATVSYHRVFLFKKFNVTTCVGLCRRLIKQGWLKP